VILTIKITGDDRDSILSRLRDLTLELSEKPYLSDGSITGGRSEVWFEIGEPGEDRTNFDPWCHHHSSDCECTR
jgi:hypothetical protein